jgi:hypothetical protein
VGVVGISTLAFVRSIAGTSESAERSPGGMIHTRRTGTGRRVKRCMRSTAQPSKSSLRCSCGQQGTDDGFGDEGIGAESDRERFAATVDREERFDGVGSYACRGDSWVVGGEGQSLGRAGELPKSPSPPKGSVGPEHQSSKPTPLA